MNNKIFYLLTVLILFIPVSSASAISCIEPIRYGNFQSDVLPPISSPDCKMMTLNVNVEQNNNVNNTKIQLNLYDQDHKTISHSSLLITIMSENQKILDELLHTHSGLLTMILKQNSNTTNWMLDDNYENRGIGWTNVDDSYIFSTSPIEKVKKYNIDISVFNVYDDTYSFKPDERPRFNFVIFTDNSGHISQLSAELIQQNNINSVPTKYLSPLQQFKSGILVDQIKCNDGLILVLKTSDETPACVKLDTKIKLIERGWAKL